MPFMVDAASCPLSQSSYLRHLPGRLAFFVKLGRTDERSYQFVGTLAHVNQIGHNAVEQTHQ